jgi:hypothetical protein
MTVTVVVDPPAPPPVTVVNPPAPPPVVVVNPSLYLVHTTAKVVALADAATIEVGQPQDLTILSVAIAGDRAFADPTAEPEDGTQFMLRIKSDGSARALSWGAMYAPSGSVPLLLATVAGRTHHVGFMYDAAEARLICLASDPRGY